MSYAISAALQAAIYQRLAGDAGVARLVGTAIFDALPAGDPPATYVVLGAEDVRDRSDVTGRGALHRFTVSVITETAGFAAAKAVAGAVSDALTGAEMALARGRLVGLWFERASARRDGKSGRMRRIDLRFAARVDES
jgi:hypothetical protein